MQQVIRGEVLDKVADEALNRQGQEHSPRNVALCVLRLFSHCGDRFEANQDQDGDAGLDEDEVEAVRRDDRGGGLVEVEGLRFLSSSALP